MRGRPRVEIDKEQFKKLCALQCTLGEIAGVFDCCEDTVQDWCKREFGETFSVVQNKYSATGKINLRRYQFKLAERNANMAIWLGKNYLGQKEQPEADDPEALNRAREILGGIDSAID